MGRVVAPVRGVRAGRGIVSASAAGVVDGAGGGIQTSVTPEGVRQPVDVVRVSETWDVAGLGALECSYLVWKGRGYVRRTVV